MLRLCFVSSVVKGFQDIVSSVLNRTGLSSNLERDIGRERSAGA